MINGYPASYYDDGFFQYPWEKAIALQDAIKKEAKNNGEATKQGEGTSCP
jgi:hypothetical protein